jgi:hypothetical protein
MEPTRTPLIWTFEKLEGAYVVLIEGTNPLEQEIWNCPLWHLAGECFAEFRTSLISLYFKGYTSIDNLKWEHLINTPNVHCNHLTRLILSETPCPNSQNTIPASTRKSYTSATVGQVKLDL